METKTKHWAKRFILICIVATVMRICTQMVDISMPLKMQHLGRSKSVAGLMTTVFSIASLVSRPAIGYLVDAKGRHIVFVWGMVASIAVICALSLGDSLIWLFGLRILSGMAFSSASVAVTTMATDCIPECRMTEGVGYYGLAQTVSMAIAPYAAIALIARLGHSKNMLVIAVPMAIALLLNIKKDKKPDTKPSPEKHGASRKALWKRCVEPNAVYPAVLMMLLIISASAMTAFLAIYGQELDLKNIGICFFGYAAGLTAPRLVMRSLLKKLGSKNTLIIGYAFAAVGIVGIFLFKAIITLTIAAFIFGSGQGMVHTVLNGTAVTNADTAHRGAANATLFMALDAGYGLGSFLWGLLADFAGTKWIYLGAAAIIAVGYISAIPLKKRL